MRAELICVGTELLLGQIVNTNAQFISQKLAEIGIDVYFHTVVGDNIKRIQQAITIAKTRADVLIFSGGLGPTEDDLTKDAIADYLQISLIEHTASAEKIIRFFQKRNIEMPENNLKQATIFQHAEPFANPNGLAVGCGLKIEKHIYLVFPGPPSEMQTMLVQEGIPYLLKIKEDHCLIFSKILRFFGYGESKIVNDIQDIIAQQDEVTIAPLLDDGEVTLRLTTKTNTKAEAENQFAPIQTRILMVLKNYYIGEGNMRLPERLLHFLCENHWTIGSAESFTGGQFLAELIKLSGASKVVKGGLITYTNEMKQKLLGVSDETLRTFGAVSAACAREMAFGVAKNLGVHIAVSFTGVAGPNQSEEKKIGTIFIGYLIHGETYEQSLYLSGTREAIQKQAVLHACAFIYRCLKNDFQAKKG